MCLSLISRYVVGRYIYVLKRCFAKKQFYIIVRYISRVEGERTKNSQKSIFMLCSLCVYVCMCVLCVSVVLVTAFEWEVAGCCVI